MAETALAKVDETTAIAPVRPREVIQQAVEEANELRGVIERQRLFSLISGKRYVRAEGWGTLAVLRGCLPREVETRELDGGRYVSVCELIRMSDGAVLSRASSECGGPEEPVWAKRPPNARRSMAQTRASAKACRIAFAWVMSLAGFEGTPAEEIEGTPEFDSHPEPSAMRAAKPKPAPKPEPVKEAAPAEVSTFVGRIFSFETKEGETKGHAWTLYKIKVVPDAGEAIEFGTFDSAVYDAAKGFYENGTEVVIEWTPTAKGSRQIVRMMEQLDI